MKVKVTGPYQVVHEDKAYTEGDTFEAPDADAQQWVTAGYVLEVKASNKAATSKSTSKK